jgi:hypothetical protein
MNENEMRQRFRASVYPMPDAGENKFKVRIDPRQLQAERVGDTVSRVPKSAEVVVIVRDYDIEVSYFNAPEQPIPGITEDDYRTFAVTAMSRELYRETQPTGDTSDSEAGWEAFESERQAKIRTYNASSLAKVEMHPR